MTRISRRGMLAASAVVPFFAMLPKISLAQGQDTLRVALGAETGNMDLLQNISILSAYTVVFDGLIHYGAGGELLPGLATAWQVADDGLSISFDLREGVTFSDGTPFDADAAEWNLKRWMGVPDFAWIGISAAYAGIVKDGANRITVQLSRPVPAALLELTIVRPVRFLSPKAVDAEGKQTSPVGTGPWIVESYDSSQTVLVRNDNYWGEKPSFGRMELKVVPDDLARANALRAGDLDIIGGDWIAPLSPRRAKALENEGMTIVADPGTATMIVGFSPRSPRMQDKGVREAILLGVDRKALSMVLYEGYADPAIDIFPAIVPLAGTRHEIPVRDVAAAQQALTAAGWEGGGAGWSKGGQPLVLDFLVSDETFPGSRRVAEMVQGMLSEVGIQVTISSVDNATMHDRRPAFDYDLALFATYGAPYDPHGTLANSFLIATDTGPDGKIYISEELDPLVMAALETAGDGREAALQKVYDWIYDNAAACPLVVVQRIWAANPRVKNFTLPATDYDIPFAGITLG